MPTHHFYAHDAAKKKGGTSREKYKRHRWQVEGAHGRAKTQHGLSRAIGRGLDNVSIQVYLTAAVMNLKKLASKQGLNHKPSGLLNALKRHTTRLALSWSSWTRSSKMYKCNYLNTRTVY